MPEPLPSLPDQLMVKGKRLEAGSAATVLVGGTVSTVVLACAAAGVGWRMPWLSVATL